MTAESVEVSQVMDQAIAHKIFGCDPVGVRNEYNGVLIGYSCTCPGKEHNEEVLHRIDRMDCTDYEWREDFLKPYSSKIEFAWEVVERLKAEGWEMILGMNTFTHEPWDCRFFFQEKKRVIAHGADAPFTICRAALRAKGIEHPDGVPFLEEDRE